LKVKPWTGLFIDTPKTEVSALIHHHLTIIESHTDAEIPSFGYGTFLIQRSHTGDNSKN